MKYEITPGSEQGIKHIFENVDIYHITKLPWQVCLQDIDRMLDEHNNDTTRAQWMLGPYGLYQSLQNYSTNFKRICEFATYGDKSFTLRQRMNIVNELSDCGFDTNLPVHITMSPKKQVINKKRVVFKDTQTLKDFHFVIHPGHTRAEGSVFTKTPLRNVLLYVKKEHRETYDISKNPCVKKINSLEEIIPVYKPDNEVLKDNLSKLKKSDNTLTFCFNMPIMGHNKGLKQHPRTDTDILKCNQIFIKDTKTSLHKSNSYLADSYMTTSNFARIFYNNKLRIFTTNVGKTDKLIEKNKQALKSLVPNIQHLDRHINVQNSLGNGIGSSINRIDSPLLNLPGDELKLLLNYVNFIKKQKEQDKDQLSDGSYEVFNPVVIKTNELYNHKRNFCLPFVKQNKYKGFCIYIDSDRLNDFNRDITELLFFINSSVTLAHNSSNSIIVVNCEHEYWKTSENFKVWEINDSFYEN